MVGRVFDGQTWQEVEDISYENVNDGEGPVKPVVDEKDGSIFVSIPSFRDGKRCAKTLKALFDSAKEPEKVFVGLVEQNSEKDVQCIMDYCSLHDVNSLGNKRSNKMDLADCPHYNQIRYMAVYNLGAKGPNYARSLARKLLGNEEYCMQIDAHSDFTKDWDVVAKKEWRMANNEYAVLSNFPASVEDKSVYEPGGAKFSEVNHQCITQIATNGIPFYPSTDSIAKVENIEKPLLANSWSAAFSFAKCHLEESAPYDNFAPQLFDAEQFPRFVRFWTRGYDVYTPTRNIVYHDYGPHPSDIDSRGWTKNEAERQQSLKRVNTLLQLPGGELSQTAQANLGLYGLGKRRTLQQLEDYVGIDMITKRGNEDLISNCAKKRWVPYDVSICPMKNMYENADDLDPQPEYPLRTLAQQLKVEDPNSPLEEIFISHKIGIKNEIEDLKFADSPSISTLLVLWILGLFVWYAVFVKDSSGKKLARSKMGRTGKIGIKDV